MSVTDARTIARARLVSAALFLLTGCAVRADLGGSAAVGDETSMDAVATETTAVETLPDASGAPDVEAGVDAPSMDAPNADEPSAEAAIDGALIPDVVVEAPSDADAGATETSLPPGSCHVDADCSDATGCDPALGCACDAQTQTCVFNHCFDYRQDQGETAVDCGGSECPGCGPNKGCSIDSDCSTTLAGCDTTAGGCYCDTMSLTCVYNHCYDHKHDVTETDTDCGGADCAGCDLGEHCLDNPDCIRSACDALSGLCVSNPCIDHRQDNDESDVDCGGFQCPGCGAGKKCVNPFDCGFGTCGGTPPVCN